MKRPIQIATMTLAAAWVVGVAAQTPDTQSSAQRRPNETITVTGCLQDRTSSPTSTAGSTTTGGNYILANATMASEKSSTTTGTTGTTTPPTTSETPSPSRSAGMNTSYVLDGQDSDLKKHVGHRIEVTGTLDANASNRPSGAAPTTGTTATGTTSTSGAHPASQIKVSSVRMISADCSAK